MGSTGKRSIGKIPPETVQAVAELLFPRAFREFRGITFEFFFGKAAEFPEEEGYGTVRYPFGGVFDAVEEREVFVEYPAFFGREDFEEDFEIFLFVGRSEFGLFFDGRAECWVHGKGIFIFIGESGYFRRRLRRSLRTFFVGTPSETA